MSEADQAQEIELLHWKLINERSKHVPVNMGPAECVECGDDMPPERRTHGFRLCVSCQKIIELTSRHRSI